MKIKHLAQLLTGLMISLLAATSFAFTSEVTLDFQEAHIKGKNAILLKKALRDQYPDLNVHNQKLKTVVVIGKSRHGHGQVQLRVRDWVSAPQNVAGNKFDFHKRKQRSYDYVTLRHDGYHSGGRWQLMMKGNFKIRKVILVMEDERLATGNWWKPVNDRVSQYHSRQDYRSSVTRGRHTSNPESIAYY